MKSSKRLIFSNAGRLYARYKKIDSLLGALDTELDKTPAEECTFLLGRIAGIEENRKHSHKKLIDSCVATKREIVESAEFPNENVFFKGYLRGIEDLLEMDRTEFKNPTDFVLFVYSEDDTLLKKYQLALSVMDVFSGFSEYGSRLYVSSNAEDICDRILNLNEKTEYLVYVVYTKDCTPEVGTLQKLCFDQYHNVYLHKDNNEENIEQIVTKLLRDTVV